MNQHAYTSLNMIFDKMPAIIIVLVIAVIVSAIGRGSNQVVIVQSPYERRHPDIGWVIIAVIALIAMVMGAD